MRRTALFLIVCLAVVLAGCTSTTGSPGEPSETESLGEPVALVLADGGYGYVDTSGAWVITPQYVWASPFTDNVAVVATAAAGGWKLIDKTNQTIAEFPKDVLVDMRGRAGYDSARKGAWISEGTLIIARDASGEITPDGAVYGFADVHGAIIVEPQYAAVEPFSDGLAAVAVNTDAGLRWGYIDQAGTMVIAPQFTRADAFADGLAFVERDAAVLPEEDGLNSLAYGYIDHSGELVIHPEPADRDGTPGLGLVTATGAFSEGVSCVVYAWKGRDGTDSGLAVINTKGKVIFKSAEYRPGCTSGFSEGLCCIATAPNSRGGSATGFIDPDGNVVIAPQGWWAVDCGTLFSDGLCAVRGTDKIGYIDTSGDLAIAQQYDAVRDFTYGLAAVAVPDSGALSWHYIDRQCKTIVAGPFQEAWPFSI